MFTIGDEMYETCKNCPYYYGEIDCCMFGEKDAPTDMPRKCKEEKEEDWYL